MRGQYTRRFRPAAERFWRKVDTNGPNGCWLWTAGRVKRGAGYGRFMMYVEGRRIVMNAQRAAWFIFRGPLSTAEFVCHNCPGGDNRACVNPDHMFIGSAQENTRDAVQKTSMNCGHKNGLARYPERSHRAKLNQESVRAIRAATERSVSDLARQFGVTVSTIDHIRRRLTWKHVT